MCLLGSSGSRRSSEVCGLGSNWSRNNSKDPDPKPRPPENLKFESLARSFPDLREPNIDLPKTVPLIMGTPEEVHLVLGNLLMYWEAHGIIVPT